jgi:hypothetical protein
VRRFVPVAALVAAALISVTSTASPVSNASDHGDSAGSFGLHLLEVPTSLANNPRAQTYIIDHLKPGMTIKRRIELSNHTKLPMRITVYPAAASITNGSFIGAAGQTVNELASWTKLSQGNLDVPVSGTLRDTVTIAVPQNAAPGERYAVVWASATGSAGGIRMVRRVGVRIYLSVGGDNPPASKFTVDTLTAERDPNNRAVVQALVHNTGGRALDMSGTLTLSAVSGMLKAGPYPVQLGTTLAPGQSEPVKAVLTDQVADGPWNATITLRSGLLDETYQAQITFPHTPGITPAAAAHPKPVGGHLKMIAGITGILLILLSATAFHIGQRRRRRTTPEPGSTG